MLEKLMQNIDLKTNWDGEELEKKTYPKKSQTM